MKPALVIPNYNHGNYIAQTLQTLKPLGMHCFLVDDGSNEATRYLLQQLAAQHSDWVTLLTHPYNRGKGAAVVSGLRTAWEQGYSHALQVDADGQHDLNDIPQLLALAQQHPQALISGLPQYDDSVPKARLYGRYITHFWVWLETLSLSIRDSMCGFRVYPLAACEALFRSEPLGERMDFDTEIMVRLYWRGTPTLHLPTRVIYPQDGVSHFQGWADNWRISKMHSRLFFGMLRRKISGQTLGPKTAEDTRHWSSIRERGSLLGLKILVACYRLGGHWLARLVMYPVIGYFFATGRSARAASRQFLQRVQALEPQHPDLQRPTDWRDSLRHFFSFGNAALDRIDAWCERITLNQVDFPEKQLLTEQLASGRGAVLLVSHIGNIELCRAISIHQRQIKVNVMVMTDNAENFNQIIKQLNPDSQLHLLQVSELSPATAMLLQDKIDAGELVVIAADRTSRHSMGRVCYVPFLGAEAALPQGPFILAGMLDCPVFTMFCVRQHGRYQVALQPFTAPLSGPRAQRQQRLQQAAQVYAERLEIMARRVPLQWFNFYDFWRRDENTTRKEMS
ncbi:glycosyltransferase family 2 protein [Shewanella dokdonensis]|uniref:Glycosyltransferase family 2 protein n=1 Tax=Shewanella dokdonensis TaxID=712036 RepID=A0ABX8DAJ4_9GAMM|nr:glycosyltransferase family 2 protein [Shewanella dokdonensis]MCL1075758.1 glycosyltransferase family 2 protein [Shewanella dokdonensis]QVK21903.1 glycosyltransferase family 2 protein [Shewanella dokdonensis]